MIDCMYICVCILFPHVHIPQCSYIVCLSVQLSNLRSERLQIIDHLHAACMSLEEYLNLLTCMAIFNQLMLYINTKLIQFSVTCHT